MKCPYCGAVYDKHSLNCPFCRSENTKEAERRYKAELKAIQKETHQLKHLPKRIIKILRKYITWIIIGILLIILASFIVREVVASKKELKKISDREYHRDVLEDYYNQGDYELMFTYYKEHDGLYGYMFAKYYEVGRAFEYLQEIRSSVACINKEKEDYKYGIYYALYSCCTLLDSAEPAVEDKLVLDNEDVLEEFIRETYDYFALLQLSEDEINALRNDHHFDSDTLVNTTKTAMSRLGLSE